MSDGKGWEEHWANENIPWDAGKPAPSLVQLLKETPQPDSAVRGPTALVPGCGSGYDAFCLAEAGYRTVGLDIAPSARSRFDSLRTEAGLTEEQVHLKTQNFFTATVEELGGPFALIWDYTFYCAIDREMRAAWKKRMLELLQPGGTLAVLLFPVDPSRPSDEGPPFALDPDEVTRALSPDFERTRLTPATSSHPGREGKEFLSLWKRPNV